MSSGNNQVNFAAPKAGGALPGTLGFLLWMASKSGAPRRPVESATNHFFM